MHALLASSRPELKDLIGYVTPQYAAHWKEIGICIGVRAEDTKIIELAYPTMLDKCCNEMFFKWLEYDVDASWDKLFTAIDSPAVSQHIESPPDSVTGKFTQGQCAILCIY